MSRLLDLDAYATGEMPDGAAADALEEALFDAPDDVDVNVLDRIALHGKILVAHGTFDMGLTHEELQARLDRGDSIHVAHAGAFNAGDAEPRVCTVSASKDFTCTVFETGLVGHDRIDVEVDMIELGMSKMIRDALVCPATGHVYALCERALATFAFGAGKARVRAFQRGGSKELLGEYFLVGLVVA